MSKRFYFNPAESDASGFTAGVSKSAVLPPAADWVTIFGLPYRKFPVLAFGAGLTPRTLATTRGTGAATLLTIPLPGDSTGNPPPYALWSWPTGGDGPWANCSQRGFLTHFITAPFAVACTIPPGVWPFGVATYRGSITAYVYLELVAYAVDATGAVVARFRDADTPASPPLSYLHSDANQVLALGAGGGTVPAGGRIAVEVWYRVLRAGDPSTAGEAAYFFCGGWNDNIPPVPGAYGLSTAAVIDAAATYVDIPGLSEDDVFDAMPDAAQPLLAHAGWLTAILAARDGREQRALFRTVPDLALEFTPADLEASRSARLDALLRHNNEAGYRLPWWPDAQPLAADLAAGTTAIPINTVGLTQLAAGADVLLYQAPGVWELGTVQSVDSETQLTLAAGTAATWTAGTVLVPVVRAVLATDHDTARVASFALAAPLTFRVVGAAPVLAGYA